MSRNLMTIGQNIKLASTVIEGQGLLRAKTVQKCDGKRMAQDCDDHTCGKEQNYWKGKIEQPEFNYLQPKFPQFDPNKATDVKEKPTIAGSLDIYKERNCRIVQECKKAASGGNDRPKCKKGGPPPA